jgi:hypothetical protein
MGRRYAKKVAAGVGGRRPRASPVWGRGGWGRDRDADSSFQRDEVAVANAGRVSPSETQLFGLLCD